MHGGDERERESSPLSPLDNVHSCIYYALMCLSMLKEQCVISFSYLKLNGIIVLSFSLL